MKRIPINIKGFEGLYEVYEDGTLYSIRKTRDLKPSVIKPYGYIAHFITGHKVKRWVKCHQLSMLHYGSKKPHGKYEIHHKDHNRANNHYSNLEWVTHSKNILMSYKENNRTGYWNGKTKPPHSIETKLKMSNAKLKPVKAINDDETVHYKSVGELCTDLMINRRTFHRYVNTGKPCKTWIIEYVT